MQDNRSSEESNISHGCCIWHGVFAWEEYSPFWPEVWESTGEHEGSAATNLQGLIPSPAFPFTALSFWGILVAMVDIFSWLFPTQILSDQVGDLGLSKVKQHTLVSGGVRGTLPWMAPELLSGKSNMVSEKVRLLCLVSTLIRPY